MATSTFPDVLAMYSEPGIQMVAPAFSGSVPGCAMKPMFWATSGSISAIDGSANDSIG